VAGAAAYGLGAFGTATPRSATAASLTAAMATAPSGGPILAGTGALGASRIGSKPKSSRPGSAVFAVGGLTSVIAANVTESRRALAGVATRLAAASPAPATTAVPAKTTVPVKGKVPAKGTVAAKAAVSAKPRVPVRATSATLSCDTSHGMLPLNVTAIVTFLLAHGYSHNAAAGIAGNIYQESKGDPESVGMGGGGLIGFTPLPGGYVTGNAAADLQTQLAAVLTYNQQWAMYLPALNSAATPASAAYIYVTDFERAGIPAAATREAAATDVAAACSI